MTLCNYLIIILRYNRPLEEIEYYIEKVNNLNEKYSLYVDLKRWSKAAEVAAIARDGDKLKEILQLSDDENLRKRIGDILQRMR